MGYRHLIFSFVFMVKGTDVYTNEYVDLEVVCRMCGEGYIECCP